MKSFTRFVSSVFPAARLPTLSPAGRLATSRPTPQAISPPFDLAYEESGDTHMSDDDCSDISDLLANLSLSDADDQDMPDLEDIDSKMRNAARHIYAANDAILLGPAIPPLNATVNITRASDMTQVGYAVVVESAAGTWPAELSGTTEQLYTGLWYSADPPSIGASITLRTKHGEFHGLATIAKIPPPASALLQYRPDETPPLDVAHVPANISHRQEAPLSPLEALDIAMVASPIVQDDVHPSHLWPTFTSAIQSIQGGATSDHHGSLMHDDSTAVTLADQDSCLMYHSDLNDIHDGYEDEFVLGGAACKNLEDVDEDIEALIESFDGLTIHDVDVDDYYYWDSEEVDLYLDGQDHSFKGDQAAAAEVDDIPADAWLEEPELGFFEEEEDDEEGEGYGVYWEEVKYAVEGGDSSDNEVSSHRDVADDHEDFFGCLDDDVVYHDVRTEQEDYEEVHEIYIEDEEHLHKYLQEEADNHYNGGVEVAVIGYEDYTPFDEGEEVVDDAAQEANPYNNNDDDDAEDDEDDEEYAAVFGADYDGEDIAVITHEEQDNDSKAAADTDKSVEDDGEANLTSSEDDTTTSDGQSDDEVDPIDALVRDFEFVDTGPKEPLPKRPLIRLVQTVTPDQMVSILKKRKSEDSGDEEMEIDNGGERKVKRLRVSYKLNKGDMVQNAEEIVHMPLLLKRSDKDAAPGEDTGRDYSPTTEKEEDKESPPLSEKARGKRRTVDEDEEPSRLSEKAKGKRRAIESDKEETQRLSEKAKGKRKARDDDDDHDDVPQDTQSLRTIKRVRFDSHPQPAAIDSGNEASDEGEDSGAEAPDFQEAVRRSLSDFSANPSQDMPLAGPSSAVLVEPEQSCSKFNLAKKKPKAKMAEKIKKVKDAVSSAFSKAKRITFKHGGKVVRTVEKKPES